MYFFNSFKKNCMYARTYGCMILKKMSFYLQRKRWWSRSSGDCLAHRTPVETAQFCHLKTREEKQNQKRKSSHQMLKESSWSEKAVCDVPDGVMLLYWKVWSLAVCHSIVMRDNQAAEQDSEDQTMLRTNWVFFFLLRFSITGYNQWLSLLRMLGAKAQQVTPRSWALFSLWSCFTCRSHSRRSP